MKAKIRNCAYLYIYINDAKTVHLYITNTWNIDWTISELDFAPHPNS